ncbi:MTH1187 family thiamine-binding protein [Sulfidibacter corallicola]|uniref:MTH1187 family thiamine-binding protein n=1 Tax=Sulfidibacter corallicola TaxID=2818388 RepID=A0A8A4TSV2_SULCO|nr:MTH1187 family thiamine-binding protein [Sulfidibacter corallicola]QTD53039.1 MTH1187 family thiamine-binding protein [Sulfidibacter corallicola]
MKVIVDVCIIPMGVGLSLSPYIAECERIFAAHGLKAQLHANGTNLEGEWDQVFGAIKVCHEKLHEMGAVRIGSTIKAFTRTDKSQSMEDKIDSVREKLQAAE